MTAKERSVHRKHLYKNFTPERRAKHLAYCKAYREKNKEQVAKSGRKKWLRHYGLTEDAYDAMFLAQNGVCFLCEQSDKQRLSIDHNHSTGKVRKLLCKKCNAGLGNFKEKISVMERAIQYLKDHQS